MEPGYELLPRRSRKSQKFVGGSERQFATNYFEVHLSKQETKVYQYGIETKPEIPKDSTKLLSKAVFEVKRKLKDDVGYLSSSGWMLWGSKSISAARSYTSTFKFMDSEHTFEIILKPTKEMLIHDLINQPEGSQKLLQLFNIKIKEGLRSLNMSELNQGKYFSNDVKADDILEQAGLRVMRGFKFTLAQVNNRLLLQIDVCSKVSRLASLLDEITHLGKDGAMNNLVGETVLTRYGKRKTYKITEVDYSKNPSHQFYSDKLVGKITYAKYYKDNYGIDIQTKNQPLIQVVAKIEKVIVNGVLVEKPFLVYLIPELVSLTGMSDEQKKNHNIMKMLNPSTKLSPNERMKETEGIISELNRSKKIVGEQVNANGYVLPAPEVRIGNKTIKTERGNLNVRDKISEPKEFKDWVFMYSRGRNPQYDDDDADEAVRIMRSAEEAFGIKLHSPVFLCVEGNKVDDWINKIGNDIDKNGAPQIVVLFFDQREEKLYGPLKKFLTCEKGVVSQVIRKRTLSKKAKNPLSAASKIIIQMNVKIGGAAWSVQRKHPYFDNKKLMYGAFSISKGKKGFTLGFVGTTNLQSSSVYSSCKIGLASKEGITQAVFEKIFMEWARAFVKNCKEAPTAIIVYREGLSHSQIRAQIPVELNALHTTIKVMGEKTKQANYRPGITYCVVNTKINSRFFSRSGNGGDRGKFTGNLSNPEPGSVVMEEMSVDFAYDFHLAAQQVTQGTCTPTHYVVAHTNTQMPQEALVQFTHQQCYNYYNWSGAVKVPACLQNANKLSKLVGESIMKDVTDCGEIQKNFFFL